MFEHSGDDARRRTARTERNHDHIRVGQPLDLQLRGQLFDRVSVSQGARDVRAARRDEHVTPFEA